MGKEREKESRSARGLVLPELTSKLVREDPERARELLDALPLPARVLAVLEHASKERMELILLSEEGRALSQALPEEEWWRTIKEVGEEDALPLVAMASEEQLTFLVDLEWWVQDILDPLMVIRWWVLFLEAGPEVLPRWLEQADEELLVLSLAKFLEVYVSDPDDLGYEPWRHLRIFSLDDTYFLHFRDPNLAPHLEQVVRVLRSRFQDRYYSILDRVRTCMPAEEEETAERLRRGRLLDHGFAEFEDAISLYAYLSPERMRALEQAAKPRQGKAEQPAGASAPRYDLVKTDLPPLLGRALAAIEDPAALEEFRFQFARLANRVLVADGAELSKLSNLAAAVDKVYGYLEIGLEVWSEGDPARGRRLLEEQWLPHIFQAGYAQALRLHRRAQRLLREGWLRQVEHPYDLLEEPIGPILEGLLKKRPAWYAGPDDKGAGTFREFRSLPEVRRAETALEQAEFLGQLFFEALGLEPGALLELEDHNLPVLTWTAVFLTALVRGALHHRFAFAPLAAPDLGRIMEEVFADGAPRRVRPELREAWAQWLGRRLSRVDPNFQRAGRAFFEQCLQRLEDEFSRLSPTSLEPKYLSTLIVSA